MAKDFARAFYNSSTWARCRDSYIALVNGLCERCLARGQIVPGYIVHHKIVLTPANINDPEIALNHVHLEYVCLDCHNDEHLHAPPENPRYTFDASGQPVPLPPSEK